MAINITNDQYRSVMQNVQNRYIRIELLNYQFQTVNRLEGICTGGSITIDANSDIRRTASVTLVVTNSDFEIQPGGQIFLDKYIKIYVGIEVLYTKEIVWTDCGLFIVDQPNYNYDPSTNTLSLSCGDLMMKLTGARDGYLPGTSVLISKGENLRQAFIDTLALGGFNKYLIADPPEPEIPLDLEFSQGASIYNLLAGLRDIWPLYQIYFQNEIFIYEQIPNGVDEPIQIDDDLWDKIVLSEQINVDFQSVKNSIEVYGRTHDPAHFSTSTTVSNNVISLTIPDVTSYTEDMIYGFTLTDNPGYNNVSLKINNLSTLPVRLEGGQDVAEIQAEEGEIYFCVQYKGTYWNWLGHLQAYAKIEDDDPNSPYYVEGPVGRIHVALYDGDYSNILTDDLAKQRAELELFLKCRMNNSITLTCVPVYWMDVNILVRYTSRRDGVTKDYLVKNVTLPLENSGNMSVNLVEFTPEIFNNY